MKMKEYFLYHIWDAQHLKTDLKTVDNRKITIKYLGEWNTDIGPDFKNALILLDGELLKGDIEIHLKTYDWESHNHSENYNFNKTILHVVYEHNVKTNHTVLENGEKIAILELKNQLNQDILKIMKSCQINHTDNRSPEDCFFFGSENIETTENLLKKMGRLRFIKKTERYNARLIDKDFNQILYEGLFEALGYSKNKFQMLSLASSIEYNFLNKWFNLNMSKEELLSIWLCSSNLINFFPEKQFPGLKESLIETYENQGFFSNNVNIDWIIFRVRPLNNPCIRVMQVLDLFYNSLENNLINKILSCFSFKKDQFSVNLFLTNLKNIFNSDFLSENYQIGYERLLALLVNIILPVLGLYADKMSYFSLKKIILDCYNDLRGYEKNWILVHMKKFMTQRQFKLVKQKPIYQQGVIQLYYSYCQNRICDLCRKNKYELIYEM